MNPVILMYDEYIKTLKKCYYYKKNKEYCNLICEIGILKGIALSLKINNIDIFNIEYNKFIDLQNKLIKKMIINK